jgi:hypothetical protein
LELSRAVACRNGKYARAGSPAGIRDAAALARLPAEEQKTFAQFWADVAALLKKAESPREQATGGVER